MHRTRVLTLPAVLLLALLAGLAGPTAAAARATPAACSGAGTSPASAKSSTARRAVLCLLNRERARRGLKPLRSHPRLRRAATRHSSHMARANFFDHTSPAGSTMTSRIRRAGYVRRARRWAIGENIAWGAGASATPRSIVRAWMRSPGHRRNVLDRRFREIGIGVAKGAPVRLNASTAGATYTTDFGYRR